jgi:DNA mismatch repair ATPase MutS
MLAVSFIISKLVMPSYLQLDKIAPQLESLSESIRWIENKEFNSDLLKRLKSKYKTGSATSSQSIKKLKKILDLLDVRLNPLAFIPLNTFLFWDLQQIFTLEKWKRANKENIGDWFAALAEMECLSSIANLHFNHPESSFPALSDKQGVFIADTMGHPLIPKEKLVCNSFSTEGLNQMNLITGSNMAGKSTFLRSVGVNIVLAMMGSPVFAKSLTLSPMKVLSSMRVSDNLEESTSTFYAELKKLKEIIEAVYAKKKIFLLLDEILRGTNSADRHTGSKALIKQLVQHNAAGLIATHDLELAKLAEEFPGNIHNYHFDVQVTNDELFFDYKLNRGVCQSMNASILMKKIGIEL